MDLSREAHNLWRFNRNFRKTRHVDFPQPLYPLVSPDVLVETFEEGRHITTYIQSEHNPHNHRLAALGSGTMLQVTTECALTHPGSNQKPPAHTPATRTYQHHHLTVTAAAAAAVARAMPVCMLQRCCSQCYVMTVVLLWQKNKTCVPAAALLPSLLPLTAMLLWRCVQMMLLDNLIHSDLHPGNILVKLEPPAGLLGLAYAAMQKLHQSADISSVNRGRIDKMLQSWQVNATHGRALQCMTAFCCTVLPLTHVAAAHG